MELYLKLHFGKKINAVNMTFERMIMFQGRNLHAQMYSYCDQVYGKGKYSLTQLTPTQYHFEEV